MKELLENAFDTAYNEYKEYETFLKNIAPKIKEQRDSFAQYAIDNSKDTEVLTDKLFEIEVEPMNYQNDLLRLKTRLWNVYQTVKEAIEIPAELKTEIDKFILPVQVYVIKAGQPVEIDPEFNKKMRDEGKKHYKKIIEQQLKNI